MMTQKDIDNMSDALRSEGLTWNQTNFVVSLVRNALYDKDAEIASLTLYAHPTPASEGMVLVPIEPTDEMLYMMYRAINTKEERVDSYKLMLEAAPKEPS